MFIRPNLTKKKKDPDLKDNSDQGQKEKSENSFDLIFDDEINENLFSIDQNYFDELDNEDIFFPDFNENPILNNENFQNTQQTGTEMPNSQIEADNLQLTANNLCILAQAETQNTQTETENLQLTTNNSYISAQNDTENSIFLEGSPTDKKKVELSYLAEKFKNNFYQIFTTKKRFSKKIVQKIHEVIRGPLNLPKMKREEMRSINLYFNEYAPISNALLIYIHHHKKEIIEKVAELRSLKI